MDETGHTEHLTALIDLYRELLTAGVTNLTLSDTRPAVLVRTPQTAPAIRIQIDPAEGVFVWRRDDHQRHPIDDPAGAAARLAEFLTARATDHSPRR